MEPQFLIKTVMEKEDYREFLYTATFRRNKKIVPLVLLMAAMCSLMLNWDNNTLNIVAFILMWVLVAALSFGAVCIMVERKSKKRIETDKTGTFGSINVLKFYDEEVVMENESLSSVGTLKYDQFYELFESRAYFIFYLSINQASLIRKKDIEDVENFKNFIIPKFENRYRSIQ